jgi:ComEC/Rec2-related protein
MLAFNNCGATVKVKVCDAVSTGEIIDWLDNPSPVDMELLEFRYTPHDRWRKASGTLAVRLPDDFRKVAYGDILELEGVFIEPSPSLVKGGFDYRRFLRTRGISRIFFVSEGKMVSRGKGFFRGILDFRDILIVRLASKIDTPANKRLMTALVFGCRQGLERKERRAFIKSGVIHIFTISGLHVGIVALIAAFLLRPFPFRARYMLLPCFIFIYVLTTGMNPPAIRAFLMISAWCICRGLLLYTTPLNIAFLAASVILLYNPMYISDVGFQYSFTIAGILIVSGGYFYKWHSYLNGIRKWMPSGGVTGAGFCIHKMKSYSTGVLMFCSVAWLASSGITLFYQGLYLPHSLVANILISPFLLFIFILSGIKILAGDISFISLPLGETIDFMFSVMNSFCSFISGAATENALCSPPLWSVILFYFMLLVFIRAERRFTFVFPACAMACIIVFWHLKGRFEPEKIIIAHGGRSVKPAVAFCAPGVRKAAVINPSSWEAVAALKEYLRIKGCYRVNFLTARRNWSEYCRGMKFIISEFDVDNLILPAGFKRCYYSSKAVASAATAGANIFIVACDSPEGQWGWRDGSGVFSAEVDLHSFRVEYMVSGNKILFEALETPSGEIEVITGKPGRESGLKFRNSSQI